MFFKLPLPTTFSNSKLFLTFSSLALLFIIIISTIFYQINKLNMAINVLNCSNLEIIQKLNIENSLQSEKILRLEELINSQKLVENSSVLPLDCSSQLGIFNLILACLSIIIIVIGAYYCFNIVFQNAIVGKFLGGINYYFCTAFDYTFFGGSNYVKTLVIPFNEYNFELKIIMKGDETCAVTYRFLSDTTFLPFERFLDSHQELLKDLDLDLTSIQNAFAGGSTQKVAEVLTNNSEEITNSFEALKLLF